MAAPSSNAVKHAFDRAIEKFKKDLENPDLYQQILQTTSIDQVYDATDQLQKEQSKTGSLRHLSKIGPFLGRLKEYADAVDTFVQAKPDILALIWGPIKLLLQWANVLKQSFDAISDTLEEVGSLMPEFCEVTKIFTDSVPLQEILVLFFRDMLDLYMIAIKFFSLTRLKFLFEALWPRRRDEIKLVTTHIARRRELMRTEVRLEEIRAADEARRRELEHFAKVEEAAIKQEYSNLRAQVSPKTYDHELYLHHGAVCEGTGKWLFRDPSFEDWVDHSKETTRILWLKGIPGAGKTLLASSVIRHTQPLSQTLFAFLTYKDTSTTALSIFHSLVFQLASDSLALQTKLHQSSHKNLRNSLEEAVDLLQSLIECAGEVYVVIDGIDEVDLAERSRLLKEFLKLGDACKKCRILLSSRSEDDISTALRGKVVDIKVDQRNAGSIQTFVNHQMKAWFDKRGFDPEVRHEIEGWAAPLASNAKGVRIHSIFNSSPLPDPCNSYERILQRIETSTDRAFHHNARMIIGWVSCAPSPMTRHELEQTLVLNPGQLDQEPRVNSVLNVVEFCGPIVEVIDDYVQFVHFTVKEYIVFKEQIDGTISLPGMTLSLAIRCICYLCQDHHDLESIEEEEMEDYILSGAYRLHNFASTYWWRLIKQYLALSKSTSIPESLIDLLQQLRDTRLAEGYQQSDPEVDMDLNTNEVILALEPTQPDLAEMLRNVFQFQRDCSKADYSLKSSERWIHLDPLTISRVSIELRQRFNTSLYETKHKRQIIAHHYGANIFKCGFLCCRFHRRGFDVESDRRSHENNHDKPWKCDVPGCEYAEIGFISRRMAEHHLQSSHSMNKHSKLAEFDKSNVDEIQPLLFDLVAANKFEAVKALSPYIEKLTNSVRKELAISAASMGSLPLLQLFFTPEILSKELCIRAIKSGNVSLSEILLTDIQKWQKAVFDRFRYKSTYDTGAAEVFGSIFAAVIESDSHKIHGFWNPVLNSVFDTPELLKVACQGSVSEHVIGATKNDASREQFLITFWEKHNALGRMSNSRRRDSLDHVASTTCSINLARYLLEHGCEVDGRRGPSFLTPLHRAAQHNTAQAAHFMEFLMMEGADPNAKTRTKYLRNEKGAVRISAWLGVSWDDLVEKVTKERQRQGKGTDEKRGTTTSPM
ncbi:uncharacterized protein NECHADRAFT_39728 [Fusarium vanettenii 77-13-4]|uniref:NACHT domain-containing protein n=1 Tax=Fusarium vanettenii (strain ATCC MYA-4622 / CBS 123669 / FGSC 9596 / NRRL 45880 / 77-13-4) TaxID=660122 RepID=C7ZM68_FUSV7|nr:uncharacterized protein NECHADRAFT_39728 [Fusarium vanettenii 77-13-4]EEU34916.1 hypothetical protein NECHADRAFT_39728 [Fusarium vanettenii 77-13-4]